MELVADSDCISEVMPITYFFLMNRVYSLQTLYAFLRIAHLILYPLQVYPSIFSVDSDKVHFLTEGWK